MTHASTQDLAAHERTLPVGAFALSGRAPIARQAPAAAVSPSVLARRLSAPSVQLLDQLALLVAFVLTKLDVPLREGKRLSAYLAVQVSVRHILTGIALIVVWRTLLWMVGMYPPHINRRALSFVWKVPATMILCTISILPLLWPLGSENLPRSAGLFWFGSCILLLTVRASVLTYEESIRPLLRPLRTAIICGTGPLARKQAIELSHSREYRYQLLGFVDSEPHGGVDGFGPVLCGVQELDRLLMHSPVDEVIIGLPLKSHFGQVEEIVRICGNAGVQVQYSLDLFNTEIAKKHTVVMDRTNRVVLEMVHLDQRLLVKEALDRALAFLVLLLISPVFLLIALAIKLTSRGPVFFVQQRFGRNKRRFGMIKFRSMVADAEVRQAELEHLNESAGPTFKMRRDPRVTRFGSLLRATSLDELPQLLNVLRGDMSLVGPRPLPVRDVERFGEPWLMRRFSVKPGITGLWQVSGRANTDFDAAIRLDLRYIDRWSLFLDFSILIRTVLAVFRRSGAY